MANWKVIALVNGEIEAVSGSAAQDRPGAQQSVFAFEFFKEQSIRNKAALQNGLTPEGRVYYREGTAFPPRKLEGITVVPVIPPDLPGAEPE